MNTPLTSALEWRIAWRHLRVGEHHPRWVDALSIVSLFMLAIGVGFVVYAAWIGPETLPGEQLFAASVSTAQQRNFGVFGGLSIAIGAMLLVLALLSRFFNLLASIITMSVLLGCMALVVVLSLMSGLEADLRDKILNQKAHLRVSGSDGNRFTDYEALVDALTSVPEVAGASPYLEAEIMVRSGINRQGAVLLGVEPERLLQVSNIADIMREGSFDALTHPDQIPDPDPFAATNTETPWRLRHLDKDKDRDGETDASKGDALLPKPRIEPKPIELPKPGEVAPSDAKPGEGGLNRLPPPPELFGAPPGAFGPPLGHLDGLDDGFDDGWEDPAEELGLDEEAPPVTPPAPAPAPVPDEDDDAWGDDAGWEDPAKILELGPAASESSDGDTDEAPAEPEPEPTLRETSRERSEGVVDPILIGRELANELVVGVGTRVQLITPVGRLTPAGRVPGILAAKVGGVFHSGMYEYDRKNVYTPLPIAQAFLRTGDRVSGIEVKLHDIEQVDAGKAAVEAKLHELGRTAPLLRRTVTRLVNAISDESLRDEIAARHGIVVGESELIVESWKELNRNLFSAMFLEKIAMFVALLFVVLVASFGILASNLMSVLEKSKEIAILKAMGGPDQLILRVFVAEGLCLGLLGAVGGISMGLGLCWALDRFGFPFNENVYYIERLPVVINPFEVAVVGVAALVIVFVSSLYPARVASRMRPVDGLRHQEK